MIRRSRLVMDLTWAVIAPSLAFAASSRADSSLEATFAVIVWRPRCRRRYRTSHSSAPLDGTISIQVNEGFGAARLPAQGRTATDDYRAKSGQNR